MESLQFVGCSWFIGLIGLVSDSPEINEKYINPFKVDETEGRIQEQLSSLNSLKNVSLNYYNELVKKENELVKIS